VMRIRNTVCPRVDMGRTGESLKLIVKRKKDSFVEPFIEINGHELPECLGCVWHSTGRASRPQGPRSRSSRHPWTCSSCTGGSRARTPAPGFPCVAKNQGSNFIFILSGICFFSVKDVPSCKRNQKSVHFSYRLPRFSRENSMFHSGT
jgi:hypothetical protein